MKKAVMVIAVFLLAGTFVFAGGKKESAGSSTGGAMEKPASEKSGALPGGTLNMGGSNTVAPVIFNTIEAYKALNPGTAMNYESVGKSESTNLTEY